MTLERLLATVLSAGTWLASATIAAGVALALTGAHAGGVRDMPIVTAGIALFILLPITRVALMAIVFAHRRDYRFAAIAVLVLAIIGVGCALGLRTARAGASTGATTSESRTPPPARSR
jgi:uncharacterized membrane protein